MELHYYILWNINANGYDKMNKKETNHQSNNREEKKRDERTEKRSLDMNRIKEIVRFIADSSYKGYYTLERHTNSLYRFGFGIVKPGDIPIMFEGKTANEAMYRAINFELAPEIKLMSRDELTKLTEDRLATIQDEQQKCKDLEEKIAAKNVECKELVKERDKLKHEQEDISAMINRIMASGMMMRLCSLLKKVLHLPLGKKDLRCLLHFFWRMLKN